MDIDSFPSSDIASTTDLEVCKEIEKKLPEVVAKYDVEKILNKGFFGKIFLARPRYSSASEFYAIKYIKWVEGSRKGREVSALQKLKGAPNIIQYVEHFENGLTTAIVMEHFPSDDFQKSFKTFSAYDVQCYMKNLLIALAAMHRYGLIHGDIKPDNYLFNNKTKVYKLIDLGLVSLEGKPLKDEGPVGYIPLESLLHCEAGSCVLDIWNVGLIFMTCLSGIYPFFLSDGLEVLKEFAVVFGSDDLLMIAWRLRKYPLAKVALANFERRPALDLHKICLTFRHKHQIVENASMPNCTNCFQVRPWCMCYEKPLRNSPFGDPFPDSTYDLVKAMLNLNPHARITAQEALMHPFFRADNLSKKPYFAPNHPGYPEGFVRSLHPKYRDMISRFS